MRAALLSLIEAMPSNIPVLWLSTITLEGDGEGEGDSTDSSEQLISLQDEKLARLVSWLSGSKIDEDSPHFVRVNTYGPNALLIQNARTEQRKELFHSFFGNLHLLPGRLYSARKQVIESRIKIHKPCVVEVAPVNVPSESSKDFNKNRSMRSGVSNKVNDSEIAPKLPPVLMTEDGDKQCVRELRNFLRATLGELHKEKKCLVFWRPVDPENVPDYYDVISCPMDLETMRMKVCVVK